MITTQFKKGVLELCVLVMLGRKDYYGYELVEDISEHIKITEGTIYPLLRKLKDDDYVTTYLKESFEGPPRKYYSITQKGSDHKEDLLNEWVDFTKSVSKIIKGE